ncbi:hypothetical protein [Gilvimarinus japonicus]|uniref:Uncharacterized protein n=1 Tax=Gilvimarinus japonicus TaxID=1796469 RepID=A0ABV7HRU0_9GAMM
MKKKLLPLAMLAGLASAAGITGCGSVNMLRNGDNADFAVVSEGEAGGAYAVFAGEGSVCKVTEFGDLSRWQVTYKGKNCEAALNGGAVKDVVKDGVVNPDALQKALSATDD